MSKYYNAESVKDEIVRVLEHTDCKDSYIDDVLRAIEKLPSVEVSDDAVSRKAVEKMLDESWVDGSEYMGDLLGDLESIPSVITQVPSEDAISREWVLEKIDECYGETEYACNLAVVLEREVRNAPSTVPTTEQSSIVGEWIDWLGKGNEWECSECKCSIESHGSIAYKYCPNCGAKMKGADNEA